jgi:hypothetical protein
MVGAVMDLDRKLGHWSLRVWGLIVNLGANALALYGAAGFIRDGSRLPLLVAGCLVTLLCVSILALPSRPDEDSGPFPPDRDEGRIRDAEHGPGVSGPPGTDANIGRRIDDG